MSRENTLVYSFLCLFLCYNLEGYFHMFLRQALMAYSLALFSFEQRLVVQSTRQYTEQKDFASFTTHGNGGPETNGMAIRP